MTARKLADKKYGTEDLKDLTDFMIPLSSALAMMEEYAGKVKKLPIPRVSKSALLDEWNAGYNRGCEDTHAAYEHQR